MTWRLAIMLVALLALVGAAVDARVPRINLLAAGLALWLLSILLTSMPI